MLADLVKIKRIKSGRSEYPSLIIIDSQSVKTAGKGEHRGFDGGKKVKGRKRQIVMDTQGSLHQILVHAANIHDSKGGAVLADIVLKKHYNVKKVLNDLGYRGFLKTLSDKSIGAKLNFQARSLASLSSNPSAGSWNAPLLGSTGHVAFPKISNKNVSIPKISSACLQFP